MDATMKVGGKKHPGPTGAKTVTNSMVARFPNSCKYHIPQIHLTKILVAIYHGSYTCVGRLVNLLQILADP